MSRKSYTSPIPIISPSYAPPKTVTLDNKTTKILNFLGGLSWNSLEGSFSGDIHIVVAECEYIHLVVFPQTPDTFLLTLTVKKRTESSSRLYTTIITLKQYTEGGLRTGDMKIIGGGRTLRKRTTKSRKTHKTRKHRRNCVKS